MKYFKSDIVLYTFTECVKLRKWVKRRSADKEVLKSFNEAIDYFLFISKNYNHRPVNIVLDTNTGYLYFSLDASIRRKIVIETEFNQEFAIYNVKAQRPWWRLFNIWLTYEP